MLASSLAFWTFFLGSCGGRSRIFSRRRGIGHLSCFFMAVGPFACFFTRFLDIFPWFLRRKIQNLLSAVRDWTFILLFHGGRSRISSRRRGIGLFSCFFMTVGPFACFFTRFLDIFPWFLRRKIQNLLSAVRDWTFILLFHGGRSRISSRRRGIGLLSCFFMAIDPEFPHGGGLDLSPAFS